MSRWSATPFLLGILVALGCTPSLTDGRYDCASSGQCPAGWTCWSSDGRCHARGAPLGEICEADGECDSGFCPTSPDAESTEGHCSVECEDALDCDGLGGDGDGVCYQGVCYGDCDDTEDCAQGQGCYLPSVRPSMGAMPAEPICFDLEDPRLRETSTCAGPTDCPLPGLCVVADVAEPTPALCAMRCTSEDTCPEGTGCVSVFDNPMGTGFCLASCGPGRNCPSGLECGTLGAAMRCIPPGWVGEELPLVPASSPDTM